MDRRYVGESGIETSVIGLGCNNFGLKLDRDAARDVVHAALDAGVTHFDTAERYSDGLSEEYLGAALGAVRKDVLVATWVAQRPVGSPYEPGALGQRIRQACEASLRRLGTDYIDLYYQHHPDSEVPIEESLETLSSLVDEGKVRTCASSNFGAKLIAEAASAGARLGGPLFVAAQLEWNLLRRDVEAQILPAARLASVGVIPYYPLASGLLTGKYRADRPLPSGSRLATLPAFSGVLTARNLVMVDRLTAIGDELGRGLIDLALGWLLSGPQVCCILTGATSGSQIVRNARAAEVRLSASELVVIDKATQVASGSLDGDISISQSWPSSQTKTEGCA